ncbi:MAG: glycosyltransferase [Cyanophyceae cyanobacterium]
MSTHQNQSLQPQHFSIFCFPSTGHLNTFIPLGHELQQRGHRVTLVGVLDVKATVLAAGLGFQPIGEQTFPIGTVAARLSQLGTLKGLAATRHTSQLVYDLAEICLQEGPVILQRIGVGACIVDQVTSEGGTVADALGLPFVSVCSALALNWHVEVPPCFTPWGYSKYPWAQLRNFMAYLWLYRLTSPLRHRIAAVRQQRQLPPHEDPNDAYSQLAQISQQPLEFEFPRQHLPQNFYFTGPFHRASPLAPPPFPFETLTGQPLIYASLGTLQNQLPGVFETIAIACQGLNVQLVIALGRTLHPDLLPTFPGNPIVVDYAPQVALIQRSALVITHGGLNTALECLTYGVPMVAIPITNDQLGVSARIAWAGVGQMIALKRLTVQRLHQAIQTVITEPSYRGNAARLQKAIDQAGGVAKAADIIEQAVGPNYSPSLSA